MLNLDEGIEKISSEMKKRRLIVFVGSGISIPAPSNLPDWDGFITEFIKLCKAIGRLLPPEVKETFNNLLLDAESRKAKDPLKVASVLRDYLKELDRNRTVNVNLQQRFEGWFSELFASRNPNHYHELIASTNFPYILTSNYDTLIEKAFENSELYSDLSLQSYSFVEADSIAAALFSKDFAIIHVHGVFSSVSLENIVFTSEDYTRMLRRRYPGFTMCMQNLFSNYSTLFIGYGGSDPHLEDLLEEQAFNMNYNSNKRLPQNFLVSLAGKTDRVMENYKKKRSTEIITIDSYNDYEVLLQRLAERHPRDNLILNHNHSKIILDDE
jgi:hypothetical protein